MYLMLLEGSYPQDIRVRKEAESMAENGLDVMVVTPWLRGQKRFEIINNVCVKRIGIHYSFNVKGILDIINSIFFINFLFYFSILKLKKDFSIKTIHFHDLPLIKTSFYLGKKIKCPVIFDMHENYPEMMEEYEMSQKSLLKKMKDRLFFNTKRWKKYEKKWIQKVQHIIAVVDEMKEKLIREYEIDSSIISVVSNYEKLNFSNKMEEDTYHFESDTFYIGYVGGISPIRGLEVVIQAIKLLKESKLKVKFLILGNGNPTYLNELIDLTKKLNIKKDVEFLGYKKFEIINYYMKSFSLNIIPHIKTEHMENTIPHKLFQIFLMNAPIIVSSCKPLKRFVEISNGGYVFDAGSPESLVEKIKYIKENEIEKIQKANNAYNYTTKYLSWEDESKKLTNIYTQFHG
jgi:glycosyltransferase involved in cell wall biosynthesis